MSLTSYRAAPPRATAWTTLLNKSLLFLKKKTLPEPDRVGTKRNNKVLTTLLTDPEDQAATYSPVP